MSLRRIAFALLLAGCATAPAVTHDLATPTNGPAPDWVNGASLEFPKESFITAVGAADKRDGAEQRARAAISEIFSVKIASQASFRESEASRNGATTERSQDASEEITTSTQMVMEDVQIVAAWD